MQAVLSRIPTEQAQEERAEKMNMDLRDPDYWDNTERWSVMFHKCRELKIVLTDYLEHEELHWCKADFTGMREQLIAEKMKLLDEVEHDN